MNLKNIVDKAKNKSNFVDLKAYISFCDEYLKFISDNLQAIIVSQNPLLRRTGTKIFARAAVRDKAGFPLLKTWQARRRTEIQPRLLAQRASRC